MSSQEYSTITCPHCGTRNFVVAANLPAGTTLGCSSCRNEIAAWHGTEAGFQPLRSAHVVSLFGGNVSPPRRTSEDDFFNSNDVEPRAHHSS
jgi:predicted Zn finger-like uncharacterized protein